ncbi:hypothetical protein D7X74_09240 [Corallococcus sp. CA047B]|uniref:hypothetical protein n=1 Tax=Corallococcus sp. CA047B TaxID=2316729 RepID=UPI000EA3A848|nr:hypothetical protein [Corallococcus sp. CA047B]RKH18574.1 hypothetical protein D7X74_09240 [Corallococcus sp. CA047B]
MGNTLHIIASCTDRKHLPVPESLRLRHTQGADAEARARAWWQRLSSNAHPTRPASQLYAGEHWSVVLGLSAIARERGFTPSLWIASAGYGLISEKALVRPYSATFARGHADSVVRDAKGHSSAEQLQVWWKTLSGCGGAPRHQARSLSQLARNQPQANFLVVASPLYITALATDLSNAAGYLHHPERLLVVSAPTPLAQGVLAPYWIPSSAHHQERLGGSRLGLHARVAREILLTSSGGGLNAPEVQKEYRQLVQQSAPLHRYNRKPMTDDDVCAFIRQAMDGGVKSWSAGLKQLRAQQFACEQHRFKSLFVKVQENT